MECQCTNAQHYKLGVTRHVRTGQRWHMNTSAVHTTQPLVDTLWKQASEGAGQPQPVELHARRPSPLSRMGPDSRSQMNPLDVSSPCITPCDSKVRTPLYTYTGVWPMARDERAAHPSNERSEAFRLDLQHVSVSAPSDPRSSDTRSANRYRLCIKYRKIVEIAQARAE